MKVAVFTGRSVGIGIVFGVLVAAGFGQFRGTDWGLAAMNGLSAGALALAFSIGMSDGRLQWYGNHPGATRGMDACLNRHRDLRGLCEGIYRGGSLHRGEEIL